MISPLLYRKTPTVRHQQRATLDEKNWQQIYTRNPSIKQQPLTDNLFTPRHKLDLPQSRPRHPLRRQWHPGIAGIQKQDRSSWILLQ